MYDLVGITLSSETLCSEVCIVFDLAITPSREAYLHAA